MKSQEQGTKLPFVVAIWRKQKVDSSGSSEPKQIGSGVIVSRETVLTASHVLNEFHSDDHLLEVRNKDERFTCEAHFERQSGNTIYDVALLSISPGYLGKLPTVVVGKPNAVFRASKRVGINDISLCGYPKDDLNGSQWSFYRFHEESNGESDENGLLTISSSALHGCSGGGMFFNVGWLLSRHYLCGIIVQGGTISKCCLNNTEFLGSITGAKYIDASLVAPKWRAWIRTAALAISFAAIPLLCFWALAWLMFKTGWESSQIRFWTFIFSVPVAALTAKSMNGAVSKALVFILATAAILFCCWEGVYLRG